MKRLLPAVALMAATVSFELPAADGTVNLTNYDSNNAIFQCNMPLFPIVILPMAGSFVQVLGGPVGSSLQVLASMGPGNPTVFSLTEPGFFDGGFGVVPGVAEFAQGSFQVRAWYGSATYDAAVGGLRGASAVFNQATGSNPLPPDVPAPARLQMPASGSASPEPPPLILGLIASAAFGLRRIAARGGISC